MKKELYHALFKRCLTLKEDEVISVSDIVKEANFHRQSFYKEYPTKDEFLIEAFTSLFNQHIQISRTIDTFFETYVSFCKIYSSTLKRVNSNYYLKRILKQVYYKLLFDAIHEYSSKIDNGDFTFIVGGLYQLTDSYLNDYLDEEVFKVKVVRLCDNIKSYCA